MDEMTVRLHADDAYYCSMLELIPAKLYFHKNEEEKLMSTRFYKVSTRALLPPSTAHRPPQRGALCESSYSSCAHGLPTYCPRTAHGLSMGPRWPPCLSLLATAYALLQLQLWYWAKAAIHPVACAPTSTP